MLKKLANGEYSLKNIFWIFGVFGFFIFFLLTSITHSSLLRFMCSGVRNCSGNVILYVLSNYVRLMTQGAQSGALLYISVHMILSACFVVYMYLVVRGLWKSAKNYEGGIFWSLMAKICLVCLALFCFKSII